MKRLACAFAVMLLLLFFPISAAAEDGAIEQMEELLPEELTEEGLTEQLGVEATLSSLIALVRGEVPEAARFFLLCLSVSVLGALSSAVTPMHRQLSEATGSAVSLILSVTLWSFLYPLIRDAIETVEALCSLATGALPIFVSVHASLGAGESALAGAAGLGGMIAALEAVLSVVILPLFSLYLSVSLIGGGDRGAVGRLSVRLYRLLLSVIALFSVVTSAVLALQSALASAKDSLLLRTVRHAAGSMIPVVGSTVSGALSTLLAGGAYVKQTVGTLSLLGILSISLPVLCRLLLCRMALGALELVPTPLGESGAITEAVKGALDLLIGIVSMAVVLFLLCVVLFLYSGGGNV